MSREQLTELLGVWEGCRIATVGRFEAGEKGHRYATVIVEPMRKEVLWIGRGRAREDIRPFFELLGREGRKRLRAVAMDMNQKKPCGARAPHG